MNVALALDALVPGAAYRGSLTANTRTAFDALVWEDDRTKPSWAQVEAWAPTLTVADYQRSVETHVDTVAGAKGYSSAVSCASYVGSTNTAWAAEAAAFVAWRDDVWETTLAALAAWQGGGEAPTVEGLVASLPAISWPS